MSEWERDWEKVLHAQVKCCACSGSLRSSTHINLVTLNKYATWKYPAYGNILARDPDKRGSKRAVAILCDECIEQKREAKWAVEFVGKGEDLRIRYHDIENLEDAEPVTEEDLEEPALNFGLEERIRQFDGLVGEAARLHPLTWCPREQSVDITMILEGRVCCQCPFFVTNGGICDPL